MLGLGLSITARPLGGAFSPRSLFAAGEQGAWYDPSDLSTLFQDAAGTTPVTAMGQPVGLLKDKSGRGNHASQATATSRPLLQQDAGGRYYLAFDGVDDWLSSGNIDLRATNKLTVFAAAAKQRDTTTQALAEFSASSSANAGVFAIFAPLVPNAGNVDFRSAGTSGAYIDAQLSSIVAVGARFVVTGVGDISAPLARLRVNSGGMLGTTDNTASQGSGNYSSQPLFIGARSGAILAFNGCLYGLILRGASSTAPQIASTERYLAARSGVTLP